MFSLLELQRPHVLRPARPRPSLSVPHAEGASSASTTVGTDASSNVSSSDADAAVGAEAAVIVQLGLLRKQKKTKWSSKTARKKAVTLKYLGSSKKKSKKENLLWRMHINPYLHCSNSNSDSISTVNNTFTLYTAETRLTSSLLFCSSDFSFHFLWMSALNPSRKASGLSELSRVIR